MIGKKGFQKGKDHHLWRGDNVSYKSLHYYVKARKKKPSKCSWCGKVTDFLDLANTSGKYTRNPDDYEYICRSCHMKDDGRLEELYIAKLRKLREQKNKQI